MAARQRIASGVSTVQEIKSAIEQLPLDDILDQS
jgi:hypothetical protein